jgi:hypothetical protein
MRELKPQIYTATFTSVALVAVSYAVRSLDPFTVVVLTAFAALLATYVIAPALEVAARYVGAEKRILRDEIERLQDALASSDEDRDSLQAKLKKLFEPAPYLRDLPSHQMHRAMSMISDVGKREMWISQILERGPVYSMGPTAKGTMDWPAIIREYERLGQLEILEVRERIYHDWLGEQFTEDIYFRVPEK